MPVYVSDKLTATLGVVRGSPTPTRLIQWFRGSTVISGANASTYTITSDDLGQPISVRQTESNYFGSAVATSAATEAVEVFSPSILFSASEPGVWFDPTDAANLAWRRNLLLWTEAWNVAPWGNILGAVVTADAGVAPNGTTTADRITFPNQYAVQMQSAPTAAGVSYTFSFYAKHETGNTALAIFHDASASGNTTPIVVTSTWQRFSVTVLGNATSGTVTFGVQDRNASGFGSTLVWGAQLELGSVATTYQPITNLNTEVIAQFPNATLYQDSIGTTPVYSPEQPVGLMLDKSKGLVLGPEKASPMSSVTLIGTGSNTFVDNGNGTWTFTVGSAGQDRPGVRLATSTGINTSFKYVVEVVSMSGSMQLRANPSSGGTPLFIPTPRTASFIARPTSEGAFDLVIEAAPATSGQTFTIRANSVSVREIPGNHATQATAISRPLYGIVPVSGRRNLLTWTEDFRTTAQAGSTRPWSHVGTTITSTSSVAPDGTSTATLVALVSGAEIQQETLSNGSNNVVSVYVKAAPSGSATHIRLSTNDGAGWNTGVSQKIALTSAWQRLQIGGDILPNSSGNVRVVIGGKTVEGNNDAECVGNVLIWGAQYETGSTATAYQKVTSDYDVTEVGVASVGYLRFDGSNDWMVTSTITPGTDKVQVFSGVRKLNSLTGIIAELSAIVSNAGSFLLYNHPDNAIKFGSRGSAALVEISGAASVPSTKVVTSLGDISGDTTTLRFDGVQVATSTADQGTGNFLAYPLYLGRRGGTSLEFNGQLFPMIVRFGPNMSSALIRTTENWVASKTAGVTLP